MSHDTPAKIALRLDDLAQLALEFHEKQKLVFRHASPEIRDRMAAVDAFAGLEADTVAKAILELADDIQALADQRSAA